MVKWTLYCLCWHSKDHRKRMSENSKQWEKENGIGVIKWKTCFSVTYAIGYSHGEEIHLSLHSSALQQWWIACLKAAGVFMRDTSFQEGGQRNIYVVYETWFLYYKEILSTPLVLSSKCHGMLVWQGKILTNLPEDWTLSLPLLLLHLKSASNSLILDSSSKTISMFDLFIYIYNFHLQFTFSGCHSEYNVTQTNCKQNS